MALDKLPLQPLGAVTLGNLRIDLSRYQDLLQLMFRGDVAGAAPFANVFVGPDTARQLRALADLVERAEQDRAGEAFADRIMGVPV